MKSLVTVYAHPEYPDTRSIILVFFFVIYVEENWWIELCLSWFTHCTITILNASLESVTNEKISNYNFGRRLKTLEAHN